MSDYANERERNYGDSDGRRAPTPENNGIASCLERTLGNLEELIGTNDRLESIIEALRGPENSANSLVKRGDEPKRGKLVRAHTIFMAKQVEDVVFQEKNRTRHLAERLEMLLS